MTPQISEWLLHDSPSGVSSGHTSEWASGNLLHVGVDCSGFSERGAGVDEQRPSATLHQSDGDVEKR